MEKVEIPRENAQEPKEEARQPQKENEMAPERRAKKILSFHESTQSSEISSSQNICSYKEALSQPAPSMSQRDKLLWLQKRRTTGLWVSCDGCNKWRFLPHVLDKHELPAKWFCELNTDRSFASCSVPEDPLKPREEEDLIHSEYSAGTVVWARLQGWPWWPAMVDDCVDIEQFYWLDGFSDIPSWYNVVFFDSKEVTRAWIPKAYIKPYAANKKFYMNAPKKFKKRINDAMKQADNADTLPIADRLAKYSFIATYKGNINEPKKLSKKQVQKFENKINKQFNIQFTESDFESDSSHSSRENTPPPKRPRKKSRTSPQNAPNREEDTNTKELETEKIANTEIPVNFFKEPYVASNLHASNTPHNESTLAVDTLEFDNDSSKTYVPESSAQPQSLCVTELHAESQDLQVRIDTPSSGDFEF